MSFHIISCHFISFHIVSISLTLSDLMEPRETILFDLCQAQNVTIVPFAYMHFRYSWWINWDISLVRQILKQGAFVSINIIYNTILHMWWCHLTQVKFRHTSRSGWNISYSRFLTNRSLEHAELVKKLMANSANFTQNCMKMVLSFLCQCTILDFAFWLFITECNGEARRQSAKHAGVLAMD